jgi:N-acetylmuramoyl-L-alanine amidase
MDIDIIKDFIPSDRSNRSGMDINGPEYITVHDTANPNEGANALMHAKYLKGTDAADRQVSWHFTVDDQRIVQHLPLDEIGWHAGDGSEGPGNRSSIGVEICENADGNRAEAEDKAARLVSQLLEKFNLNISVVVQHHRWSGKNCPHILRSRKDGWNSFISEVEANMSKSQYSDVTDTHWAAEAIRRASQEGLMTGYKDGTFRPDQHLTRAELAIVIDRLLNRGI